MDGGICSQIHFFLIGQYLKQKGYKILYDINWFENCGYDKNHVFVRNFDLLKLTPDIKFETIENNWILSTFKKHFKGKYDFFQDNSNSLSWKDEQPPLYMGNYYKDFPELFTKFFPAYFNLKEIVKCLDKKNLEILKQIKDAKNPVAIHVRRGDLASGDVAYGFPCDYSYFIRSIQLLIHKNSSDFYFFSDEPDWIRKNLLGQLPPGYNYNVVDVNGSDKGYMDLVLIGSCKHIITSKGSFGKYAALLNLEKEKIVVMKNDETELFWRDVFQNSVYID